MKFFENLEELSQDPQIFKDYLASNLSKVYDYFELQKDSELIAIKNDLRIYISNNITFISELEKNDNSLTFIALLLNACERLGLTSQFKQLYELLSNTDFVLGSRLKASALYLVGINVIQQHFERYDNFYGLLSQAYNEEEDGVNKLIATIVNYYVRLLVDFGRFNIEGVERLREKLLTSAGEDPNSFLNDNFIQEILNGNLDFKESPIEINQKLEAFLNREIILPPVNPEPLIEDSGDYIELFKTTDKNFYSIKKISQDLYRHLQDDSIFYSLKRGVGILTEELQLFAYMHSYGNMHYAKLITAFNSLPKTIFDETLNVIDWGCGQAMATITYFDYLNDNGYQTKSKYFTLIEPSEIALKRAAAHLKGYFTEIEINTINKTLDNLNEDDFTSSPNLPNLHLFSNIIDIEHISLTKLLSLIDNTFKGLNYFVCVSPFIDDLRTSRLNAFMRHFSNYPEFEVLQNINSKKGEWQENPGWTRVIRVFKCVI
ncbi:hypothetical protein [Chryseobacterium phocaeense]|uniref:hypothetical protein n=1 Tax=Chryseobacterium phocaeense TaxID=1816690 RepID=UPI0009BC124E|nr:hypothetical protein [Chryseobacterium phocaeense]